MRAATVVMVAVVMVASALAAVLGGCAAHQPPPSFTDDELEAYFGARVDAAWENTGLAASMQRLPAPTPSARSRDDNPGELMVCLSEKGMDSWGMGESNGGPTFLTGSGEPAMPEEQLAWFDCLQRNPHASSFEQNLLTEDQKHYLYDYYQRWVIPCLITNDRALDYVPTRVEYVEQWSSWIPYHSLEPSYPTEAQYEEDVRLCGEPLADLENVPTLW